MLRFRNTRTYPGHYIIVLLLCLLAFDIDLYGQEFREISKLIGADKVTVDQNIMSGGIAVIDYNADNYLDIFIPGGENPNVLLKNNWDGTFVDVSEETNISLRKSNCVGVSVGDINNDGLDDLFITTYEGEANILLLNEGGSQFIDISETAGIVHKAWSTSSTFGDFNLDGLLDIYVANYANFNSLPFAEHIDDCESNYLYENIGNNQFRNVAEEIGLDDIGCGLAVSFMDYDLDNDVDLMIANDFGLTFEPNQLYINERLTGQFQPIEEFSNLQVRINAMGIAKGDYDEDGDLDLYFTNIAENPFFDFQGDNIYLDIAHIRNVANSDGTSWGAVFADVNNDSFLDLIVSNGQVIDAAHQNNRNKLYTGNSNGRFVDVSEVSGIASDFRCRGLSVADLDNDGDIELLFGTVSETRQTEIHNLIYDNTTSAQRNWLKLKPVGKNSNRNGYGGHIRLVAGDRNIIREIDGGSSYLSHNSNTVHIGLGEIDLVDTLVINWPGGNQNVLENVSVNKYYSIIENSGLYEHSNETISITEGDSIQLGGMYYSESGVFNYMEAHQGMNYIRFVKLEVEERSMVEIDNLYFSCDPNPITPDSRVKLKLPIDGFLNLVLTDIMGRMKTVVINQEMHNGELEILLEEFMTGISSGMYLLKLQFDKEYKVIKIIVP